MSKPIPTYQFTHTRACSSTGETGKACLARYGPCSVTGKNECVRETISPLNMGVRIPLMKQLSDYLSEIDMNTDLHIISHDGYAPDLGDVFSIGVIGGVCIILAKEMPTTEDVIGGCETKSKPEECLNVGTGYSVLDSPVCIGHKTYPVTHTSCTVQQMIDYLNSLSDSYEKLDELQQHFNTLLDGRAIIHTRIIDGRVVFRISD